MSSFVLFIFVNLRNLRMQLVSFKNGPYLQITQIKQKNVIVHHLRLDLPLIHYVENLDNKIGSINQLDSGDLEE